MKIATKLTKRVAEFILEVNGFDYSCHGDEMFFHYPNYFNKTGFKEGDHTSHRVIYGYTSVSEQQFIDMVTADLAGNTENPKEMKTKCIVLGQDIEPVKELKKIELKECLQQGTGNFSDLIGIVYNGDFHSSFSELALNPLYKIKGMDLIFATKRNGKGVQVWLGHWNDGVV